MNKFFDKIERDLYNKAFENEGGDFGFTLDTGKYRLEMSLATESKHYVGKGGRKSLTTYTVSELSILDENDKNIADRFPLLVEKLNKLVPDYNDVMDEVRDSNLTETERVFGSEANYLHYRYGY